MTPGWNGHVQKSPVNRAIDSTGNFDLTSAYIQNIYRQQNSRKTTKIKST